MAVVPLSIPYVTMLLAKLAGSPMRDALRSPENHELCSRSAKAVRSGFSGRRHAICRLDRWRAVQWQLAVQLRQGADR